MLLQLAAVFLVAVVPPAPVNGAVTRATVPCTASADFNKYQNFLKNHILPDNFGELEEEAKMKVLRRRYDHCRPLTQSFMAGKANVVNICQSGKRVRGGGNLCISSQPMAVYDVIASERRRDCVLTIKESVKPVVVACDLVRGHTSAACVPVHFERYTTQVPSEDNCSSRSSSRT